jgi:hypothetical protein
VGREDERQGERMQQLSWCIDTTPLCRGMNSTQKKLWKQKNAVEAKKRLIEDE